MASEDAANPENTQITHKEVMKLIHKGLMEILDDPLLKDLSSDVTAEEVNLKLALAHGQAFTINVLRADNVVLPVVVTQTATVHDLKKAIKHHMTLKLQREGGARHISWRYIWKTYWLCFQGEKLSDDKKPIKEYGIRNHDEVTFMKRLKQKHAVP